MADADTRLLPSDVESLRSIRADALHRLGRTGRGVGIAVLDTGVSPHPSLAGRIRGGVNLSGLGGLDDAPVDWFGHGTFVAALAAGDGDAAPFSEFPGGVAPGAHVIPVKVAGPDGATDITNVIAAFQWIVAHADELGIRVVNLSFGTNSRLHFAEDPLNHVVERAWDAGIVVVVAAGNRHGSQSVTTPGQDPLVLTVGSSRGGGTATVADDEVDRDSSHGIVGDDIERPDVVAPGERLVSAGVPGSFVHARQPASIRGEGWQRASGTSFSAALVSGAVALLLEGHPEWTPDQVKGALMATAHPIAGPAGRQGAGIIDVAAADGLVAPPVANRQARRGSLALHGTLGLVEKARGDVVVEAEPDGEPVPLDATAPTTPVAGLALEKKRLRTRGWTAADWDELYRSASWARLHWPGHDWASDPEWDGEQWTGAGWWGAGWWGAGWWGAGWWGHGWG